MKHLKRSICIAFSVGFIAAMPIVLSIITSANWLQDFPQVIVAPFALVCPPWELFWATMGHPNDMSLLLRISATVLFLNAALYAPLGVLHSYALRFSTAIRRSIIGIAYVFLLTAGHLFFLG